MISQNMWLGGQGWGCSKHSRDTQGYKGPVTSLLREVMTSRCGYLWRVEQGAWASFKNADTEGGLSAFPEPRQSEEDSSQGVLTLPTLGPRLLELTEKGGN